MKYKYVDLFQLGFYHEDKETGEITFDSVCGDQTITPMYATKMNLREFGNLVNDICKASETGLSAKLQRLRAIERVHECASKFFGEMTMGGRLRGDGESWIPMNLPLNGIVNVKSDKVIRVVDKVVDGRMTRVVQLKVPLDQEARDELRDAYEILDSQHSSSAMSDEYGKWEPETENTPTRAGFMAITYVYMDLDEKAQAILYDNKNFNAQRAPTDQETDHKRLLGDMTKEEQICYDMIDAMATQLFDVGGGHIGYSVVRGSIKTSQAQKGQLVTKSAIMRFAMYNQSKNKHKQYTVRKTNLISEMSNEKFGFGDNAYAYACGMNEFAMTFNEVHGRTRDDIVNMFAVNKNAGVSPSKIAAAFSFAQAAATIVAKKEGLSWNRDSLRGICAILRDNVMEGETFLSYDGFKVAGGGDMYTRARKMREDLVTVCSNMSADEIIAHGRIDVFA